MIEELNGDYIQWLRGFYYIAKTGSIRRAAQLMNRSSSTISYQLKALEEDLHTVLFDRYKKSLVIKEDGRRLLEWTISTFETLKSMRSEVGSMQGHLQGTTIFSCNLPFARIVVDTVAEFRAENPDVNIFIKRAMPWEVINDVEASRVDFGLTGLTSIPALVQFEELFHSRPLLVMRKDSRYLLPQDFVLSDLASIPFVSFLSEQMDDTGDPFFGANETLRPYIKNTAVSVNSNFLMLQYVLRDAGAAIMDELTISSSSVAGGPFITYPLDRWLPVVHYGLLVRRQKHLSPQAQAIIDFIRTHFQKSS